MEKVFNIANMYVATLRVIYLIHQHCHWLAKGPNSYGDHLLFERLYKSAQTDADKAAEKFIGLFGEEGVDFDAQNNCINKLLQKYGEYHGQRSAEMALAIEKDFLAFSKQALDIFKSEGKKTDGLDDMIMSIASNREESCYLLQQTLSSQ